MVEQLHKKFTDEAVKSLLDKYLAKGIKVSYVSEILGIKRSRLFELLKKYKGNPAGFSVGYNRKTGNRIDDKIEKNILKELTFERDKIIKDKDVPVSSYNYSYIKRLLYDKYQQTVSVPTIIDRAKKNDFYIPRRKRKVHDREILTNYAGELIQHDSSHHKWAPYAREKWYLITSIDDYSRMLLYAELVKNDTTWAHILALQSVFLTYGMPLRYYVDSHSIFRFVQGRDSIWRNHRKVTDEAITQWKQVLNDCNVDVTHSLSPQAKGKIERPYGWLQDNIVRTCVRENVQDIEDGRDILRREVDRYNYRQLHSTTGEIPWIRFNRAMKEKKSLFREFSIKPPYQSPKDIFCLRDERTVDKYAEISFKSIRFKLPTSAINQKVQLRISPDLETGMAEIRFWYKGGFLNTQKVKNDDFNLVHF